MSSSRPAGGRAARPRLLLILLAALSLLSSVAFVLARFVFGLGDQQVFVLTTLGALPAAQNVFNYAQRYGAAVPVARDVVLISTIGAVPVLVAIAALLHP